MLTLVHIHVSYIGISTMDTVWESPVICRPTATITVITTMKLRDFTSSQNSKSIAYS